jgi:hypothetical protein
VSRYFFQVHNIPPKLDEIGEELPNDEAAWREATIAAGSIFKDVNGRMRPDQEWALEVTDQTKTPLFQIRISTKKLK